jgi:hypothetical protein
MRTIGRAISILSGQTGRIHCRERPASQVDHPFTKAAVRADPVTDPLRVHLPHQFGCVRIAGGAACHVRRPCGVKTERCVGRHADPLARKKRQHQGTGRRTLTVDDDPLAGIPRPGVFRNVLRDAPAIIIHDPLSRGRRYPHQRNHHQYEETHFRPDAFGTSAFPACAQAARLDTERAGLEWVDF